VKGVIGGKRARVWRGKEEAFCPVKCRSLILNIRDLKFDGKYPHYARDVFFHLSKEFSLNLSNYAPLKKN